MDVKTLTDEKVWVGGWYQPIEFPDGSRTHSSKYADFFKRDDFGERKWKRCIEPYLVGKDNFLEIGCNAGLFLILAEKYGYKNVFGIESFDYFHKQAKYVLEKFNSKAFLYKANALDFDYTRFKSIDTILMSHILYWLGVNTNGHPYPDYDEKLHKFMIRMSLLTKRLIIIGGEKVNRIGGDLEITLPFVQKYFRVVHSEIINTGYRIINVIVADSKVVVGHIEIDTLLEQLYESSEISKEFVDSSKMLIEGYLRHFEWIKNHRETVKINNLDNDRIHDLCLNYLDLMYSIQKLGLLQGITIQNRKPLQIDGWHRLLIMKAFGYKTIPYREIDG